MLKLVKLIDVYQKKRTIKGKKQKRYHALNKNHHMIKRH